MIKYCIFDLDGTLLYTLPTIAHYINLVFARHSIPAVETDECRRLVGGGAKNLITSALAARGITDAGVVGKYLAEYLEEYDDDPYYLTEIYDGIPELLRALKAEGVKLLVLSNKPDAATVAVIDRFFPNEFDAVRGGRSGVPLKPSPEAVYDLLAELDASPSECGYVGDSDVDVITAIVSHVAKNVTVTWGYRDVSELASAGATTLCATPDEVRKALLDS